MIDYPKLKKQPSSVQVLDVFKGYNRNLRIAEGEFRDMENLSSECYPALSPRKRRRTLLDINNLSAMASPREGKLTGMIYLNRHGLVYTQGANLYQFGVHNPFSEMELNDETKRLIRFGDNVVIYPDMKYFSATYPSLWGIMGNTVEITEGKVTFELCNAEGEAYEGATASDTAPESPANKELWIDTSETPHVLKQYAEATQKWAAVSATYVKISGLRSGNGDPFEPNDGVTISGARGAAASLNGAAVLQSASSSASVVVAGMLDATYTQDCAVDGPIKIERTIPVMDFMVEAGNRLWGCRYGVNSKGEMVNEIYGSKLGDFRNWNCFMGISTDSWAASVGSPGAFTGAAVIDGNPVFYKENMKHTVWISGSGAHQISSAPCSGVKQNCGGSVASIDGAAIYKSERGFCVDDGSGPVEIGKCFAGVDYSQAIGCAHGHKYYVSMKDAEENGHLFVYDADKGLWHRDDGLQAISFEKVNFGVVAISEDGERIIDLSGKYIEENKMETAVRWMAETGELELSSPASKYISRLTLRLSMEVGAKLTVYAQYDSEPEWTVLGSIQGTSLRSFSLPVYPRRCDHLRLRFEGEGDAKLYSIAKTVAEGSEMA